MTNMAAVQSAQGTAKPKATEAKQAKQTAGFDFGKLLQKAQQAEKQAAKQAGNSAKGLDWRETQQLKKLADVMQSTGQAQATDPKLSEIAKQLIQAMSGENGEDGDLMGLLLQLQARLRELAEEEGGQMAAEQWMALLSMLSNQQPAETKEGQSDSGAALPEISTEQTAVTGTKTSTAEAWLQTFLQASPEQLDVLLQQGVARYQDIAQAAAQGEAKPEQAVAPAEQTIARPEQAAPVMEQAATQAAAQAVPRAPQSEPLKAAANQGEQDGIQVVETEKAETPKVVSLNQFEANVRMVKQRLQGEMPEEKADEPDIEKLQQQVDSGLHLKGTPLATTVAEKAPTALPETISQQVENGIVAGMKKGESDFSIKLNPEGLGEVTVHLAKTAEGMALNIVAKSSETQKLLANELEVLRESMRPLKVDVQSVVTEQQEQPMDGQKNFGQGQRQGQGPFQDFKGPAYYGDEPLGAQNAEEQAEIDAQIQQDMQLHNAMLRTFI